MIIGNGLIAQAFRPYFCDDDDVMIFASGVSNSRETRAEEFARERALLVEHLAHGKYTVYFSTCSVHDPELSHSPYTQHKADLEALVRERAPTSAIFRLPQVVGATPNPFTLTNYLAEQVRSGTPFNVWTRARRNLIDVADVAAIGTALIKSHKVDKLTTNIACPFNIGVVELVRIFEDVMDKPARCIMVDAGAGYALDTRVAEETARQLGLSFGPDYIRNLVRKYYG